MVVIWGSHNKLRKKRNRFCGRAKTVDEAFEIIKKTLKENNVPYFYTRMWQKEGTIFVDYGSHAYFFFIHGAPPLNTVFK